MKREKREQVERMKRQTAAAVLKRTVTRKWSISSVFPREATRRCWANWAAFGKKLRQRVGEYRDKFVAGCLANPEFRIEGWRDEAAARTLAEKVFGDCGRVALYAFCKSHAVCYALLAYRSAYLQAHWPTVRV